MISQNRAPGLRPLAILLVALSLSIGWGVRGNWGHETGAMVPGALAAIAACLLSGRDDWYRRVNYFAFLGALGWSFGGSISYMIVIGYTHSGDFAYGSVPYGFACLFLIGFLWGAFGGAGTALPATMEYKRLVAWFTPILVVFIAWWIQGTLMGLAELDRSVLDRRFGVWLGGLIRFFNEESLNWHDTDWLAAITAPLAVWLWELSRIEIAKAAARLVLLVALAALLLLVLGPLVGWLPAAGVAVGTLLLLGLWWGPISEGTMLVAYLSAGWWLGFLLLTELFGLSMTPPRSENWSGMVGMTLAMFVFLFQRRLAVVAWSALVAGLFGGLGFSGAQLLKLSGIRLATALKEHEMHLHEIDPTRSDFWLTVWQKAEVINWHSVLEQSFGFISGIGIALMLGYLATRTPRHDTAQPRRHWSDTFSLLFVLLGITYLNISKNIESTWLPAKVVSQVMYGLSVYTWFNIAYLLIAVMVIVPVWYHRHRRPLPLVPPSWLGRSQLLFVVFLWWIVVGNLMHTTPFNEGRLVTEGVIHVNAVLATLLALLLPRPDLRLIDRPQPDYAAQTRRLAIASLIGLVVWIAVESQMVRLMWGDRFIGHSGLHIRFGPAATHLDPKEIRRQQILRWGHELPDGSASDRAGEKNDSAGDGEKQP